MAVYAIGDVQGCYDELLNLLDKIGFNDHRDQLWFTGDLVNRGPESLKTLRFVKALEHSAIVVLGNHDLHLLATAYDHCKPGKKDTIDAVLTAPDRSELLEWLRHQPLVHMDDDTGFSMIHAGLHPSWSVQCAQELAREVESVIQGDDHVKFYRHMYGDKPVNWSEKLNSGPRLRFITNVLTRLRFCSPDGKPALRAKGPPGTQPAGTVPWFDVPGRASLEDRIIFGHWSTLTLSKDRAFTNVFPLDTGCLWGGSLTAMRPDDDANECLRINCPGAQKPAKHK
jgi:bis(5'-nucleosyl)-tetraphosphatase (symmetrical)